MSRSVLMVASTGTSQAFARCRARLQLSSADWRTRLAMVSPEPRGRFAVRACLFDPVAGEIVPRLSQAHPFDALQSPRACGHLHGGVSPLLPVELYHVSHPNEHAYEI
jgi:hypothetical protein